jgi:hypothetical protein
VDARSTRPRRFGSGETLMRLIRAPSFSDILDDLARIRRAFARR